MIHSARFVAVLDACVLYPAPIRDLLLHLAAAQLYTPKWTAVIHAEWIRNLLLNRPDLRPEQLEKTRAAMCAAFPDAEVVHFESLIEGLALPDADDRHLLAAAIRCHADVIVTANLKDFPAAALRPYDVEAQHPDAFVANLVDLNPEKAVEAFLLLIGRLKNPPRTARQILDNLRKVEMKSTADKLAYLL
jgi:hypothetical protein